MPDPYYVVRQSSIHNNGVYAARQIPPGIKIIQYVGEIISQEEGIRREQQHEEMAKQDPHRGRVYVMDLEDGTYLDGDIGNNPAKYINHSCDPNCEISYENGEIWICSKRTIEPGEELFFNYGFGLDCYEKHPCLCGTSRCVGYILDEELWPQIKQKEQQTCKIAPTIKSK
ncbi:SET domain-containing protein-lysine N-methyltransferase [Candidatus Woesearchaeota archaeon]|nr:SET domain-containing protein-lysine N-methyltransferase [Candidatus Woesearchaeota archaeon]